MNKENILNEIINNCKTLMQFVTIKENYSEFEKAVSYIKSELSEYNIQEIKINNYPNLVISNTDDFNLDVIFCGHIDVVPCEEYTARLEDNKLYGRGAFDMKSQLSVIISLLKNNTFSKKVAFIITCDEEIGGYCCKEILKNYNAKIAVIPDAGKNFDLIVEEKGLLQLEILVKGKSAHSSEPFNGENAIVNAIKIYEGLTNLYEQPKCADDYKTTINLSKLEGGNATNSVPDIAKMVLDVRFVKDFSKDEFIQNIYKLYKNVDVNILDYGPNFYVDENLEIIKKFISDAGSLLGRNINISKCLATSDAIYFSEKNIPSILMNPIGDFWHSSNEYVNVESLYDLYLIFKTLL